MKEQRLGPIPLLSGLQTQPAEGKLTGLLRAINMEARDGVCQTRRGTSMRQALFFNDLIVAASKFPADWTGQLVTYAGFQAADVQAFPGAIIEFNMLVIGAYVADEGFTFDFYGNDNAWHPLQVERIGSMRDGDIVGGTVPATKRSHVVFTVPNGWQNANPSLGAIRCWIRVTRTAVWLTDSQFEYSVINRDLSLIGPPSRLVSVNARGTDLVCYAAAWRSPNQAISFWSIWKTPTPDTSLNPGVKFANATFIPYPGATDPDTLYDGTHEAPALLYIPSTNELLVALGASYWVGTPTAAQGTFTKLVITPPDERYADIGTEAALPPKPACTALFGGRVFLAGFLGDPQSIIWSAPLAFWKTWPSSNIARVSGGRVVAMIPIDQTLFIFTANAIWRLLLGDPAAGNESNAFLDLVEETGCAAGASVVAVGKSIVFLGNDGVRVFDGQRSRLISDGVRDLFRPDSEHPLACLRKQTAVGCWHPIENKYLLAYASPGSPYNDTVLVINLADRTCWLWGDDPTSNAESGVENPAQGFIGQRRRAVRAQSMAYDRVAEKIVAIDPGGIIFEIDSGPDDLGTPIAWYAETQNLRIGHAERSVLGRVEAMVLRDNFANVSIQAIPDGDRARADTKTVTVQPDALVTSTVIGQQSLAGNITPLQLEASIAPIRARFRKAGRNHRVRLASVAPTHDPIKLVALSAFLAADERGR